MRIIIFFSGHKITKAWRILSPPNYFACLHGLRYFKKTLRAGRAGHYVSS